MSYKPHQKAARAIANGYFKTEEQILQVLKEKIPPGRRGLWLGIGIGIGLIGGFVAGAIGLISAALNLI